MRQPYRENWGSRTASNYYFTFDHLGSVREMTDSNGNVQAEYGYYLYGKQTKIRGDLNADFGYAGYYTHAPSGLDLTMYRAYNPDLGRWISRDPSGEDGGINLYGYVGNDPINEIDPLGLIDYPTPYGTMVLSNLDTPGLPLAFPPAGINTVYKGIPSNSQTFTALNGQTFLAPMGTDFANEYAAGQLSGNDIFQIYANIGFFGNFDFQRNYGLGPCSNNVFYRQFTNGSNYGVGIFMNGGGFSLEDTLNIAEGFANAFTGGFTNTQVQWWTNGWNDAEAGQPNGVTPDN